MDTPDNYLPELAKAHGMLFLERIEAIDPTLETTLPDTWSLIRHRIVPISCANGRPQLAIADPTDYETRDIAVFLLKKQMDAIDFVVCPSPEIDRAIGMFYS